ncbi:protein-export chaperone SecB [Sphingomonas naphthae]|uniref:Protein-export protein SecB n=1 Tax=Sphingomonas naphthae TaxID=1813468 RepID=A0ABY7TKU2_9SPHN|nr:protein-export chaperone SecB [Sphingomonas naphthae]WCT73332.1 protein-export chaperone SecB [Sphingomonas naphthae]
MAEDAGTITTSISNGQDDGPQLAILAQYVKDLSFENPNAPASYQWADAPQIDVQFNLGSTQVGEDVYEVVLKINVNAAVNGQTAFAVELLYAGLFGLRGFPTEHLEPFLYAEAPRLLFPFARRVVAEAVRDGNYPPLLLDPIDFSQIYLQQAAQNLAGAEPAGEA